MYTPEQINIIRHQAKAYKLSAPFEYYTMTSSRLAEICNGCGPDSWPASARLAMTYLYRHHKCAVSIHDVRYELSDGTEASREKADKEFLSNMKKEWKAQFGVFRWFRPCARYDRRKFQAAYVAVRIGGKKAWQEAYEHREGMKDVGA